MRSGRRRCPWRCGLHHHQLLYYWHAAPSWPAAPPRPACPLVCLLACLPEYQKNQLNRPTIGGSICQKRQRDSSGEEFGHSRRQLMLRPWRWRRNARSSASWDLRQGWFQGISSTRAGPATRRECCWVCCCPGTCAAASSTRRRPVCWFPPAFAAAAAVPLTWSPQNCPGCPGRQWPRRWRPTTFLPSASPAALSTSLASACASSRQQLDGPGCSPEPDGRARRAARRTAMRMTFALTICQKYKGRAVFL